MADTDLLIIGGGINGCGIARDAAGRGLRVTVAEMGDLGGATSSGSTKLFHGGLRYLEYFEFRLVAEALKEREVLLSTMPHISWPMRFVLPLHSAMRFDAETPASRLLSRVMPWLAGRRPSWMVRAGLFLYDRLGKRKLLPGTAAIDLRNGPEGAPLKDHLTRAFEYSDGWVDDARLVVLNARDAADRGADIRVRTRVTGARRLDDHWVVQLEDVDTGETSEISARAVVNAGGPWAGDVLTGTLGQNATARVRLVRGSHIVVRRMFDHDKAYFLQGADGRIIFAIPYEQDFTLIGTTDAEHEDPDAAPVCTPEERDYLITFANTYFQQQLTSDDVVWTYSGVRPLYDDGATSATAATRDYVLKLDTNAAPLLSVFGGKITTYRKLAEAALAKLLGALGHDGAPWTAQARLPGGDMAVGGHGDLVASLRAEYPFLTEHWARRLARCYGTCARDWLGDATALGDLGRDFGETITAAELDYAISREWVRGGADFLWRRSKLGLRVSDDQAAAIDAYIKGKVQP